MGFTSLLATRQDDTRGKVGEARGQVVNFQRERSPVAGGMAN